MSVTQKCAAVVVGAGPAGLAVVGNLLERQVGKVAWIDPYFQSGRVNRKYREVPSNTKVALFKAYATAVQPFRTVIKNTPSPSPFTTLEKLDPNKTCHLHHAGDMVRALSEDINLDGPHQTPRLQTRGELNLHTPRLVLCTGASPTTAPLPVRDSNIKTLDLDTVLKPSDLMSELPRSEPTTVAVVGASHSAILALLNLLDLARSTHPHLRIKWFTRHALRYAEYMDGWILRDNTGLKGLAAEFARTQLEDEALPTSDAGRYITKVDCSAGKETAQFQTHLPACQFVVQAVGFRNDPLPQLSRDGHPLGEPQFDHESGTFSDARGGALPGLFGAGIAFPERVVDPYGNVEMAVGFWKFMRFVQRVCPLWVE
ncbi:hypothetical protein PHISP_02806 [Aspergillus sp. HF37]|nr:hypothetical protein PHISP_02806 [Aspergillus sp. HF37]